MKPAWAVRCWWSCLAQDCNGQVLVWMQFPPEKLCCHQDRPLQPTGVKYTALARRWFCHQSYISVRGLGHPSCIRQGEHLCQPSSTGYQRSRRPLRLCLISTAVLNKEIKLFLSTQEQKASVDLRLTIQKTNVQSRCTHILLIFGCKLSYHPGESCPFSLQSGGYKPTRGSSSPLHRHGQMHLWWLMDKNSRASSSNEGHRFSHFFLEAWKHSGSQGRGKEWEWEMGESKRNALSLLDSISSCFLGDIFLSPDRKLCSYPSQPWQPLASTKKEKLDQHPENHILLYGAFYPACSGGGCCRVATQGSSGDRKHQ